MEALLTFFENYLDYPLFSIIILAGIYITQFAKEILPKTGDRYKVLFISILAAVTMFFIEGGGRLTLPRYIFTYFAATSFYEIIGHWVLLMVKKKFSTKDDEKDSEKKPNFDTVSDDNGGELPKNPPPSRP